MAKDTHQELHTEIVQHTALAEDAPKASLLEIDGTIIFISVSFIIFTVVMQKVLYGPISDIRKKRKEYIENIKAEADQASDEANQLMLEYNEKIKGAKRKVSEKTAAIMEDANQEKSKILAEKKQDVDNLLTDGRHQIQQEKKEAFNQLKDNIGNYAYEISKKLLNEEIPITGVSPEAINRAMNK